MVGRAEEKGEGRLKGTIRLGAGGPLVRVGVEEGDTMAGRYSDVDALCGDRPLIGLA